MKNFLFLVGAIALAEGNQTPEPKVWACGRSTVDSSEVKEVCFGYSIGPYQEYLIADLGSRGRFTYEKSRRILLNDGKNAIATLSDAKGNKSKIYMKWHHVEGTYPGDGEDYPLSVFGRTPEGHKFRVETLAPPAL